MRKILIILFAFLLIPSVLAIDVSVEKISKNEAMILGLNEPITFQINVTNNGQKDSFEFYTFFGPGLEPKEAINFEKGESKLINLTVYPRTDLQTKGIVSFSYFIQGKDKTEVEKKLTVNMKEIGEAFKIGAGSIKPESNTLEIYIKNKLNYNFKKVYVNLKSAFFEIDGDLKLGPYEEKRFSINLNQSEFNELQAGFYTLVAKVEFKGLKGEIEEKIEFLEKNLIETKEDNYGFLIFTNVIEKTNKGNTVEETEIVIKKNILSRLFTSFEPRPLIVERQDRTIYYTWNKKLNPGESFEVKVKTNWLIPLIIIIFLVGIVIIVKKAALTDLQLRKKITFVKANGGEFALKVTVIAEAKKFVEKVRILERLPPLVKIYNKFGTEIPSRYNKTKKQLEWEFEALEAGERRILTYIVYSKIGILGKFALPSSIAFYEKEGKTKEASSNKAFFLSEQRNKDEF